MTHFFWQMSSSNEEVEEQQVTQEDGDIQVDTPTVPSKHFTTIRKKVRKGKYAGNEVKYFHCNYCTKSFQGPGSSSVLKHLRNSHSKKCPDLLPSSGDRAIHTRGFFDKKKMTEPFNSDVFMGKLLKWIIKTDQPFSVVDNEHFEDLLEYLKKVLLTLNNIIGHNTQLPPNYHETIGGTLQSAKG
jgi:hypothetical protein